MTLRQRTILAEIGKAAERRGLVLMLHDRIVTGLDGEPAPVADMLVDTVKAAWAATDGKPDRHAHVAQMTAAIARSAAGHSGPLQVGRTAWVLMCSYALTGAPPRRQA